ncbi:MAG: alkaline shock response membrane anchor protein AmaP [bacterium]|nr:alkaline shock response membrane anchor protein AmaP [Bacillota bacterium]
MSTGDRFLLIVAAILLVVAAVSVVLMAFNWGPAINLGMRLTSEFVYGRWEAAIVGGVMLAIGLRLIRLSLARRKVLGALVARSELGEISITVAAVENMVQRTALQVAGIREVRPAVVAQPEGVAVRIKAWVEKEANVPELAEEVQEILSSHLKEVAGLTATSISVEVQGVGTEPTFRTRAPR